MKPKHNISDPGRQGLSDEQLLNFLEGRLPEPERKAVEAYLSSADAMELDALEGLRTLGANEARGMQHQLNASLWKRISQRRSRRRSIGMQQWNLIAIVVVLLLAIASMLVFWMLRK